MIMPECFITIYASQTSLLRLVSRTIIPVKFTKYLPWHKAAVLAWVTISNAYQGRAQDANG